MTGCLFLIAVFGAALFAAHGRAAALDLPHAWPLAALLALTTTLAIGSLQGLWLAWRRREDSDHEPTELVDGATVRLSGVLQPEGAPLTAPYSGRPAVFAGRQWRHTLVFALLLVLLAVAAHWAVLGDDGSRVRKVLESLAGA